MTSTVNSANRKARDSMASRASLNIQKLKLRSNLQRSQMLSRDRPEQNFPKIADGLLRTGRPSTDPVSTAQICQSRTSDVSLDPVFATSTLTRQISSINSRLLEKVCTS